MKNYFIFLCVLISCSVASATTQTAANQDKPPYVYVENYNMNDQVSGTYHWEGTSGEYAGQWINEPLTCSANFYGLMDGASGLIGAGSVDIKLLENESDGYYTTYTDHMMEQDSNSMPALVDVEHFTYTTNAENYTNNFPGWSFPIVRVHCDINGTSFNSASVVGQYENWSVTRRRGAQTVLKLKTGGKVTSRLRNVFGLSASAVQASPSFPSLSEDNWDGLWGLDYENDHTSGTNIPSQNITIGSYGNLNSSGVLYKILPDNADVVVTPSVANMDYYTFDVSATKYLSYFDVYVEQGNPGGILPFGSNDVGHSWWALRTDAPQSAINLFLSATNQFFLTNSPYGYYPIGNVLSGPGALNFQDHAQSTNILRTFYIGFGDLKNGVQFVQALYNQPGTYQLFGHNCVMATEDAAIATGGSSIDVGGTPQAFDERISIMYPTSMIYSPLVLP